jgi:hypothetical protein
VPRAFGIAASLRGVGLLFNKGKYLLADPMTSFRPEAAV